MNRRRRTWTLLVIALVALLVAGGVLRALSARKAQQEAVAQASAAKATAVIELAATDVVRAETRELAQGLPISGSLKAVNSAVVSTPGRPLNRRPAQSSGPPRICHCHASCSGRT